MRAVQFKASKFTKTPVSLGEILVSASGLTLEKIKEAAEKGALWIQKQGKGKTLRERDIQVSVSGEDKVWLYYDARILSLPSFNQPISLEDNKHYGVWIKPAGIMPQGTQSSDHTSLLRAVEKVRGSEVYLVHRLDRETEGLMVIAYTSQGAARLSDLFQKNQIVKKYQARVLGKMKPGEKQTIKASLDDKIAITHYEVLASDDQTSVLEVTIDTGRLHQIRRHLDFISHPVMGDPKYGKGNKNKSGLQLIATYLSFTDPWSKGFREWRLEKSLLN